MRCLLRQITNTHEAGTTHRDRGIEKSELTIGRGTDQHVFLSDLHVTLSHAVIKPLPDQQFAVQSRAPSGFRHNGRTRQTIVARFGDRIEIGRSRIRLRKPPSGYDLLVEYEDAGADRAGHRAKAATSLAETRLGSRPWAWALFLVVLAFGIGLPVWEAMQPPIAATEGGTTERRQGDEAGLRQFVPGHGFWNTGPMARAHSFFADDCRQCHQKPFEPVTNQACSDCHRALPHHADTRQLLSETRLDEVRCGNCHMEHNGTESLVLTDTRLCTDCHAEPDERMPSAELGRVTDFGDDHPQFRVRLTSVTDNGMVEASRRLMMLRLRDDPGIKFPHDEHLEPGGVEGPDGKEPLACASCHNLAQGGIQMEPVDMEADCRRCHRLDFEPADPDRQLPHGDVARVLDYLDAYYSRRALQGGYEGDDVPWIVRQRRRPGEELEGERRRAALDWAEDKAAMVADEVFSKRVCTECHEVREKAQDVELARRWDVRPVYMNQNWFPAARFTHAPHLTADCTECHQDAVESDASNDVLMPKIDDCRSCHGGVGEEQQVATTCVDCHRFHQADFHLIGKQDPKSDTGTVYRNPH